MHEKNERRKHAVSGVANREWFPAVPRPAPARMAELLRRHAGVCAKLLIAVVAVGLSGGETLHAQDEMAGREPRAGTLLLRMQRGYRVATRIDTEVAIRASGLVARTYLKQAFVNDGEDWVEGVYVFPLPDGAAVDGLKLHIGDRLIEGEVRERKRAKREYDKARADGRKASLVEQHRPNLFETSVANIAPGEKVIIEIEYLETVRYDEGAFSLRVPMTFTPRYIPGMPVSDRQGSGWSPDTTQVLDASLVTPPVVERSESHRLSLDVRIDAGVPLELVASRYHPIRVDDDGDAYRVRLAGGDVPMDHDIELLWRPERSVAPRALAFGETTGGEPHLLLLLLPPDDAGNEVWQGEMPRELIFVIDTSGSMHGVSIEQARLALKLALDGLDDHDMFNVIQFNSVTGALYPRSALATPGNIADARRYVDGLEADGGTEMRPALELALGGRPPESYLRQVVFITDGSVGNESELFGVIEERLGGARLFTVGIGSAPNGWFMRKAAEAGRGTNVTIGALHEAGEKIARLFRKIERPQLTGIRVEWPDSIEADAYPAVVPDLYAGEPIVLNVRLRRPPRAGDQLRITGHAPGGTWGAEIPLAGRPDAPGVAALWGRARVEALTDAESRGADTEVIRSAILETALAHRLVTRYTSLVAVDRTPARAAEALLKREQVPNLLPHGQSMRAIFGFPATATPAPGMRVAGSVAILLATLMLLQQVWTGAGLFRVSPRRD